MNDHQYSDNATDNTKMILGQSWSYRPVSDQEKICPDGMVKDTQIISQDRGFGVLVTYHKFLHALHGAVSFLHHSVLRLEIFCKSQISLGNALIRRVLTKQKTMHFPTHFKVNLW